MTTALTNITAPERIDENLALLTHLLLSRSGMKTGDPGLSDQDLRDMLDAMSKPAHVAWTMARVIALLNPYFDKATPQTVREIDAEDWAEAIREYPKWAIERACRWWKSADNPHRRKRPLEGDIEARILKEMEPVIVARKCMNAGQPLALRPPDTSQAGDPRITSERANQIMAEAGFSPKRIGY